MIAFILRRLLFLFLLINSSVFGQQYSAPLDIKMLLSGTFGELRGNHFHSGIDIKTDGVEGQKVYAIAEGYISRIKVSAWGYGKAIYINHPDGRTSVYAHLQKFNNKIDSIVKMEHYKKESFELFQDMKGRVEEEIVRYLFGVRLAEGSNVSNSPSAKRKAAPLVMNHPDATPVLNRSAQSPGLPSRQTPKPARTGGDDVIKTVRNKGPKVGRNEPCPCGSGKKYKKCHGGTAA